MELNSHEPGVNASRKLNYFNELSVGRLTCDNKTALCQLFAEYIVELLAVAVSFINKLIAVNLTGNSTCFELAGI